MTPSALVITGVRLHPSSDAATGLLGWVGFRYGALRLDGVALRRTRDGTLRLAIPRRRDSAGRERDLVRPLDRQARAEIEVQVLEALEHQGVVA